MPTSAAELNKPGIIAVSVTQDMLQVELSDGRWLSVPLAWYPRLQHASETERVAWRIVGNGAGIHWESVDEDISMDALLAGRASAESRPSLQRWLARRGPQS